MTPIDWQADLDERIAEVCGETHKMTDTRLPNVEPDWHEKRCGHNFEYADCPYERCRGREALAASQGVLTGGNHLAKLLVHKLGPDFAERCPPDMDPQDALHFLHATPEYDVWCCWSAIMRFRAALPEAA